MCVIWIKVKELNISATECNLVRRTNNDNFSKRPLVYLREWYLLWNAVTELFIHTGIKPVEIPKENFGSFLHIYDFQR